VNQAGSQGSGPGAGQVALRGSARGADDWADLRPAIRWLAGRRPVLAAAIAMVIAQVGWRAEFLSRMYFSQQDFFNLDFALRSPLSWRYLTYAGTGHLMIGERAIIWVLARISLYDWGLACAVTLALLAAADAAAFVALRTLFGERPAILIPLAFYLLSPLEMAALGWWTVALESVPLQLATLMALHCHVRYVRTGRLRPLAGAVAWVCAGLLFSEKGMVVPLLLLALTSGFLAGGGAWAAGLRRALARHWRAWAAYAAALGCYLIVLATSLATSVTRPRVPPSAAAVVTFGWGLVRNTLLPGLAGGPWRWWPVPGSWYALGAAPSGLAWLSLAAAVLVIGASVAWRRVAWRAWLAGAIWVAAADLAPVVIARLNWYPALLALDTRYVADAVPVLAVCAALAFLPLAGEPAAAPAAGISAWARRPEATRPVPAAWRSAAAAAAVIVAGGSAWSAVAYRSATTGQPAARYIAAAALAAGQAPAGTPVLDSALPPQLRDVTSGTRAVIGPLAGGRLRWIERPSGTIDGLRVFGPGGRLRPAWVYGTASGRPPGGRSCFPGRGGQVFVPFLRAAPHLTTTLRIGYIWESGAPMTANVIYGTSVEVLTFLPGLHTAYVPVSGPAGGVTVTGITGGRLCVGDAEAGGIGPVTPGGAP